MADIDNNSGLVSEVTSHVEMNGNNEEASHMDGDIVDQVGVDATDEEMLQNALADATHGFTAVQLQYTEENEALQDGALINNGIQFINDPTGGQENNDQLPETFVNVADNSDVNFINGTGFLNETDKTDSIEYVTNQDELSSGLQEQPIAINDEQFLQSSDVTQPQIIVQQHLPQSGAPLGSSQNPIRIIQQGNHYTPVQQLSTDQLQQIMQVVQQQQVGKNIAAGSSVLFNPQTNTRIVYRVIYPSQLHKDGDSGKTSEQTVLASIPRRTYKKRIKEEDQEKLDGPELSREEKEQRKKTRPKTRSGRVSKPPKHMVKDFKHIHVLDYDEDYDDSDGGYSDFKYEGEDEPPDRKDDDDNFVSYGVDSMKPKRWKCITCEKAYIGRAGLARHLRLNPLHGSIDVEGDGDMEPPDASITPVSGEDVTPSTPATPNGFNSTANSTASFSEDSRDSSISLTFTPTRRPRSYRGRHRVPRASWRGRGAYHKVDPETRRINKLKEITKECSDEELMEIVLPRLAKVITLWEFLLMKVEKGNPAWPHADDIYREYEKLHQHMKKLCEEYLQYVSEPERDTEDQHTLLQIEHTAVAQSLGLHVGAHKVREIADTDADIQYKYKFLTTNQSVDFHYTNKSFLKRTVEVVSPEQIVSPAKKHKPAPIRSSHDRNLICSEDTAAISVNSANTNAIMNTTPFISKIKILSPAKVSQYCTSGKASSGKTVSLLSNSFSKHSQSASSSQSSLPSVSSSLSSVSSSLSSLSKSSQKVLIVSGRNSSVERSSASTLGAISVPVRTSSVQLPAPSLVNQPGDQLVTLTNGQDLNSHNRIILHDNVTGTYTVCSVSENLTNTSPVRTNHVQNCTSQPVIIGLPPSPSPQYMQPKFDVNDMNLLNNDPSETNNFQQIITSVADENILTRQILNMKQDVDCIPSESNEGSSVANLDPNTQNVIFTLANGDPVQLTTDDSGETGNIAYELTNGDPSQENVIFTVDPDSMLVSELNSDQSAGAANDRETACVSHLLQTNGQDEVVGVINSIDTSAPMKVEPKSIMESSSDISWQLVDNVSTVDETQQLLNTTQMNGNALMIDGTLDEDQTQLAAIINDGDKMSVGLKTSSEYETVCEDAIQGETIQIPATNIYQTEDGLIFIQNPDGTALQLQGADGQALSMETVQTLLGMDSEPSQFIAEQNPTA